MRRRLQKWKKKAATPSPEPLDDNSSKGATTSSNSGAKDLATYEEAREWSLLFANVVKDISDASDMLSPLKSTMSLLIRGLEITRNINDNTEAWKELESDLQAQAKQIKEWTADLERENRQANPSATGALRHYNEAIMEIKIRIDEVRPHSKGGVLKVMRRAGSVKLEQDAITGLTQRLEKAFKRFSEAMAIVLSRQISDLQEQVSQMQVGFRREFQVLKSNIQINYGTADSFLHLSYGRDLELCERGTRLGVLAAIRNWAEDPSIKQPIFLLRDAAGTGKSTVAATMADEWITTKRLAARFFFSPNSSATSVINHFCVTLAKDLAVQIPSLRSSIYTIIQESPISHFGFKQQFERLFVEPLQNVAAPSPLFLIVDALDNCDLEGRTMLLECLMTRLPSISNLKVLLTSQPLSDIDNALSGSSVVHGHDIQLLHMDDTTFKDVVIYVNKRLPRLSAEQRQKLIDHSGGLFIWAATACRVLKKSRRPELFDQLLRADSHDQLSQLYLAALQQASAGQHGYEPMMNILRCVIAAFQPISISTIEDLLPDNKEVNTVVRDLGGVLKCDGPDKPIFVIHTSFREFLCQGKHANGFMIDMPSSHDMIAVACIELLADLEYDMLQVHGELVPLNGEIQDLEARLNQRISTAMKYASSYWAHHAAAAQESPVIWKQVMHFLDTKFLPWVELMSWRDCLPGCLQGLSQLLSKSEGLRLGSLPLLTLSDYWKIKDTHQFVMKNQDLLQGSALHAYSAPLAFSPRDSPLFQSYRTKYRSTMPNVILRDWDNFATESNADQIIETSTQIHASQEAQQSTSVPHVAFSPSGQVFVCGYEEPVDGEAPALQMWDMETGSPVGERMLGCVIGITAVAFSPDGSRVAAGSKDGTLLLWNMSTLSQIGKPMKGHRNEICCIVFSPDGHHLASSSSDQIQIWDAESTETIWSIKRDTNNAVIAFSPEGTEIAGVGHNNKVETGDAEAICVWDYKTDEAKDGGIADSYTDALAFSPTETLLASSHHDCIRIWEVDDAIIPVAEIALLPDLQLGRMNGSYPLGISSDGTLLAYGHSVWNITSLPPRRLDPAKRPSSLLEPGGYAHSLLTYVDGWIYAAWPQGRLIPVPQCMRVHFDRWTAWGTQLVVWTESRQPVVIDCSPLLP